MKLSELIKGVEIIRATGSMDVDISSVAYDSRNVTSGTLFVAIKGIKTDGHLYIKDSIAKGAEALIIEKGEKAPDVTSPYSSVPVITVPDSRKAIAQLAINYYENPSKALRLIGVTGTNGKTTTTYLIRSILEAANNKVGLIGTISWSNGNKILPADHTTPEAVEFQGLLREMADNGCRFAVTEVSSHSLALKRVYGTDFSTTVFTNLTQDHLDFHADMEEYFHAKSLLFSGMSPQGSAVINIDDPYGRRLLKTAKGSVYSYGISRDADIHGKDVRLSIDGIEFDAITPSGHAHIKSGLIGRHNIYNILAAIGAALCHNIPMGNISSGILSLLTVPGRFEKIDSGLGFSIVVDYAHTENALRLLLEAATKFSPRRIITLFGCGGDRDRGKRPLMGEASVELSDYVIVTSDNPRSEDPEKIIEEVEGGIKSAMLGDRARAAGYKCITDRRSAIEEAINMAEKGDLIIIAGKGHECHQITGGNKLHFDDKEEAREAVRKRACQC